MSIDDGQIDKLTIYQDYNTEPTFIEKFIIDFKNKKAYWDLNPDFFWKLEEYKDLYASDYNMTFKVFEKFYSKVSLETYPLTDEKINEFFGKFDFIESFPIYDEERMYSDKCCLNRFLVFRLLLIIHMA